MVDTKEKAKELHPHVRSFIATQKWEHLHTDGRHGHPNPGKAEFAAFIEKQKDFLLNRSKNPAAWERIRPELEEALASFPD